MKPFVFSAVIALAMLLGAALAWKLTPCPEPITPDPTLQLRFDSVARVNASLQARFDSLSTLPPVTIRIREALRSSTSLSLDSIGVDMLADPN